MLPDIGFWEFLLIACVAIIFIKPDDWPRVLRKIGQTYGRFHETMGQLRRYGREAYDEIVRSDGAAEPRDTPKDTRWTVTEETSTDLRSDSSVDKSSPESSRPDAP